MSSFTILGDSNAIATKGLIHSMNDIADMLKDLQIDVNVTTTNNKKIESIKEFDNIATSAKKLFVESLCKHSLNDESGIKTIFKYLSYKNKNSSDFKLIILDVDEDYYIECYIKNIKKYTKFILALPPYVVPDSLRGELRECREQVKQMWKNKRRDYLENRFHSRYSPSEEDWEDFGKVFLNSDLCIKILVHTKFDKRHKNMAEYSGYDLFTEEHETNESLPNNLAWDLLYDENSNNGTIYTGIISSIRQEMKEVYSVDAAIPKLFSNLSKDKIQEAMSILTTSGISHIDSKSLIETPIQVDSISSEIENDIKDIFSLSQNVNKTITRHIDTLDDIMINNTDYNSYTDTNKKLVSNLKETCEIIGEVLQQISNTLLNIETETSPRAKRRALIGSINQMKIALDDITNILGGKKVSSEDSMASCQSDSNKTEGSRTRLADNPFMGEVER